MNSSATLYCCSSPQFAVLEETGWKTAFKGVSWLVATGTQVTLSCAAFPVPRAKGGLLTHPRRACPGTAFPCTVEEHRRGTRAKAHRSSSKGTWLGQRQATGGGAGSALPLGSPGSSPFKLPSSETSPFPGAPGTERPWNKSRQAKSSGVPSQVGADRRLMRFAKSS